MLCDSDSAAVEADVISYNSSISSCEKAGHWREALCLLVDLLEQSMNSGCKRVVDPSWIIPSTRIYDYTTPSNSGEGWKVAVLDLTHFDPLETLWIMWIMKIMWGTD